MAIQFTTTRTMSAPRVRRLVVSCVTIVGCRGDVASEASTADEEATVSGTTQGTDGPAPTSGMAEEDTGASGDVTTSGATTQETDGSETMSGTTEGGTGETGSCDLNDGLRDANPWLRRLTPDGGELWHAAFSTVVVGSPQRLDRTGCQCSSALQEAKNSSIVPSHFFF